MARNNEMTQIIKMLEMLQTRMDENEKKMELMVITLQTNVTVTPKEDAEKPHNEGGEDDRKGKAYGKRKEEEGEKKALQSLSLIHI